MRGSAATAMKYQSTRGAQRGTPFETVLLSAYASDGGLFVPEELPQLSRAVLASWAGKPLSQVTAQIVHRFTGLPLEECEPLCARAFASFNDGREPSLPLRRVGRHGLFLETGAGPTLAFKDIGQQ
eukprot:4492957-Prymnesium_polylepis.1